MESFKKLLDDKDISQISQELSLFIHSADGYANRLKLVYVLLGLMNESCNLLKTIEVEDFISDICKRIEDVEAESNNVKEIYRRHLDSNNEISAVLVNPNRNDISDLKKKIEELLEKFDNLLKQIMADREKLPLDKLLKEQEQK